MLSPVARKRIIAASAAILPIAALCVYLLGAPTQKVRAGAGCIQNSTQKCVYTENGQVKNGTQYCQADGTWSQCV